MARVERYLVSGEEALRLEYNGAIADEEAVLEELRELARQVDELTQDGLSGGEERDCAQDVCAVERFRRLSFASTDWRFLNEFMFNPPPEVTLEPRLDPAHRDEVYELYDEVQLAARELDGAIVSEVDRARLRMEDQLTLQTRLTRVLAGLAFFATLIVGRVAYRYRDLTLDRELRRQEAVRARREVDALLEATGDGVLGIDLGGRCISLNRAGEQLVGYTQGEILGRDVHATLFHTRQDGRPWPREESELIRAITEGRSVESPDDALIWRRRGLPFPARWSLRPMVDGVELRGAVLTFTDMTETLKRQEELRRAVKQREDVVSIVSHDLRNPLGVALAAAELLIDLPLDEEQRQRQAEIIHRSGKRMQRLIEDLLDVSRIEAHALVVRLSREELQPILEEAYELFHDQARSKGVRLELRDPQGDTEARIDADRILQALSNLLDNAVRVTPAGGRITLSARDDGEDVVLSVADTGPGVQSALIDTLFDRFSQTAGTDRGAAGLGLTIVRGVADAHGGEATVSTEEGKGSEFILRVPREGPPRDKPAAEDGSMDGGSHDPA
ncbi:MAG: PAS domain-containing sensor histidine kinase, partial [Gemmatimonadetes bacterium]|nr:PAS domain-containing sensor histidine kinase [Gemmatimonadota bacterium]